MNNNFIYSTTAQYFTKCLLNVTDNCNLNCKYCFVQQQPHYMSLETAKKAVDFIYNNLQKKINLGLIDIDSKAILTFFGGEPMLCYKTIIVPIVKYCNKKYPNKFNFGITTNGTLLNKTKIKFLKQNNFNILLSLDGTKETQDFNRSCKAKESSYKLITKHISYLLKLFPNLSCRSTIYAPTVQNLFNDYLYIESLGFKNWDAMIDQRHKWTDKKISILKEQISKIYQYRLKQIIEKKPVLNSSFLNKWFLYTINIITNNNLYFQMNLKDIIYRCGLGTISGAIGWDGSIYGCQEQVSQGKSSIFYIGNIYNNGIDIQKHYNLLNIYYNTQIKKQQQIIEKCNNCLLQNICQKFIIDCPSTTYDLFNDMQSITDIECQMKKIYFNNSLITLEKIFTLNNQNIINYFITIIQEGG